MSCRTGTTLSIVAAVLAFLLAVASSGCTGGSGGGGECADDKCDSAGDFKSQLEGRADPIAQFLQAATADGDGVMKADYRSILFGVAEKMGCPADSVSTFILSDNLLGDEPFPRLISVACSTDDVKASDFFIAASFKDEKSGDVDFRRIEMFAWDATARKYRFYKAEPTDAVDQVDVDIDPKECQQCHLTPSDLASTGMPMTPIMNEINRPWTHWNAEPDFPSLDFELPQGIAEKSNFTELVDAHKGSASRFEEIIRNGGHTKVAQARLRERRNPANIDEVMNLLRPVFCSEQINYVSEDHDSGVAFNSIVVDPGIRNMLKQVRADNWPFGWVNGDTLRLAQPAPGAGLTQIPVRGSADVITEQQMVALRALTANQVLRVRALDWKKPVFSEFRCGLWTSARERFQSDAPSLAGLSKNSDAMPVVLEAIMEVDGVKLDPGATDRVIAMADATADGAALQQAIGDGTLASATCAEDGSGFCVADVDQLGAMIDQHVRSFEEAADPRAALTEERLRRICVILEEVEPADDRFESQPIRFENRPALPAECP